MAGTVGDFTKRLNNKFLGNKQVRSEDTIVLKEIGASGIRSVETVDVSSASNIAPGAYWTFGSPQGTDLFPRGVLGQSIKSRYWVQYEIDGVRNLALPGDVTETPLVVSISAGETAAGVAAATASVLNVRTDIPLTASSTADVVTLSHNFQAATTFAKDGVNRPTGFVFAVTASGTEVPKRVIDIRELGQVTAITPGSPATEITLAAADGDTDGSLGGTHWTLDAPAAISGSPIGDASSFYVWYDVAPRAEISTATVLPQSNGSLSGTFFHLNAPAGSHYVWYDVPGVAEVSSATNESGDTNGSLGGDFFHLNAPAGSHYVWYDVPGVAEVTRVETVADVAGSLGGEYFTLDTAGSNHYVWYTVPGVAEVTRVETPDANGLTTSASADYFQINAPTGDFFYVWYDVTAVAEVTRLDTFPSASIFVQASATAADYFQLFAPAGDFYVWYDVINGSANDPLASGTGLQVIVGSTDVPNVVASLTAIVISGDINFGAVASADSVIVTNASVGDVPDASIAGAIPIVPTVLTQGISPSIDPNPFGDGIQVTVATDATDPVMASLTAIAIDAEPFFGAVASATSVLVTNASVGVTVDASNLLVVGLTVSTITQGVDIVGTDPNPGGTGIEVPFVLNDTLTTIAAQTASVVNGIAAFSATASGFAVTITNTANGSSTDATVGTASGFTVSVLVQGLDDSVDPAPGGTGITVPIARNATVAVVSSNLVVAIDGNANFTASGVTEGPWITTITNASVGAVVDIRDGDVGTMSFATPTQGADDAVDPAPGGSGIAVALARSAATQLVGSATAAAISTSPEFSASAPIGEGPFIVTVNNASVGSVVDIRDGSAATGFAFATTTQGIDVSVDPAPPGKEGITVSLVGDDTGTTVANETGSAVNANIRFSASVAGSVVTITNASAGAAVDAADVDTGFAISTATQGASIPNAATGGSITNVVGAGVGGSPVGVSTFDLAGSVWRVCESNLFPNPDFDIETS